LVKKLPNWFALNPLFQKNYAVMIMRYSFKSLMLICALFVCVHAQAQQVFFRDFGGSPVAKRGAVRQIMPDKFRLLQSGKGELSSFLQRLPLEANLFNRAAAPVISLPMPDGSSARFRIWQTPILEEGLARQMPEVLTVTGQGIDDPYATIKIDWTSFGFHAMILSDVTGTICIDPYDNLTNEFYISYYKKDHKKQRHFHELEPLRMASQNVPAEILAGVCTGTQLRTYRLAVACTHQYAIAATGLPSPTKAQAQARIVTTINRVNGVYERELSIRMTLIANNTKVVFVSSATDIFNGNDDPGILIDESQNIIDDSIGTANYDIGHTFSTGAGGLAGLGVACINGAKASGVTGSSNPVGDAYDIDYVAHELGHQFSGNHTFNGLNGACGGNGTTDANSEPGSGSTIMGYAGICDADNLQNNSDPQFHAISHDEISTYSVSGFGNTCAVKTNTGNSLPVVNAGSAFIIPVSTPFVLTGSATDANGDALTFSWEQVNVGGTFGNWNAPSGNAPLFRSFAPVTTPVRHFPRLSTQVANTTVIGEFLPSYARVMNFRLTARDNRAGGGGVCYAQTTVTTNAQAGPFLVTSPNVAGIVWTAGDFATITWNKASTDADPINCANVQIELSTDGGFTYPVVVLASTPNDGSEEIVVPNNVSTTVRIRVRAVGNIFYDISNFNLRIQAATAPSFVFNSPVAVNVCGANSGVATLRTASQAGFTTNVTLAASLNPVGTTVAFGTNPIAPGASTTVTLNNTAGLAPGTYTVRVTGTAGAVVKTRDIQFVIGASPAAPVLSLPANDAIGLVAKPTFNWAADPGALSYALELSKSSNFSTLYASFSGITSLPFVFPGALGEDSVYFWRVKTANACGTGLPNVNAFRFKTGLNSCRISGDVPKQIPTTTATITSVINIPAALGVTITDVNVVGLEGTHSFVEDLDVILTSPTGTSITLFSGICGSNPDFDLNLDDQSATAIFPCPPIGGVTVRPQQALSAFNGQNSAGTWTLTINDLAADDGGALTGWGLKFNGTGNTCTIISTPLATTYTFTGNGNWSDAANWANNTVPPALLPSGSVIVVNHTVGGVCRLNVSQQIAAGATLQVLTGKNLLVPGNLNIQ
jgi:subtilisin-like proprotein convertase family protein